MRRLWWNSILSIQEAIVFAFTEVAKLASARQAVIWPLERDLDLTSRYINGDVVWRRPTCATIPQMIANPIYGGAYVCGKSGSVPRYDGDLKFDAGRVYERLA